MKYKVGDKVRIVDQWNDDCCQNLEGKMDEWLGKVVTIVAVTPWGGYRMKEDDCTWGWNDAAIAGLAEDFEKESSVDDGTSALREMAASAFSVFKGLWKIAYGHEPSNIGNADKRVSDSTPKFEVGDRVEYHHDPNFDYTIPFGLKDGEAGIVRKVNTVSGEILYLVEFDHYDNPEGCVVRETELTKRPIYYTAKIVCVDNHHLPHWQVGKIYHVTDGQLEGDDHPSCNKLRYTNLAAINGTHFAQFIEVVD